MFIASLIFITRKIKGFLLSRWCIIFVSQILHIFNSFLPSFVCQMLRFTSKELHRHRTIHCSSRTNKTSRRENASRAECSTHGIIQPRGERMTAIECKSYPVFRDFLLLDIIIIIFLNNHRIRMGAQYATNDKVIALLSTSHFSTKKNYFVIWGRGDNQSIDESIPQSTSSIRHFSP